MAHPRMYEESNKLIKRLRQLCLALPGVLEKEAWGECTFRVSGGKMFAMTDNNHHHSGHLAVWVTAPPTVQETLVRSRPNRFFKPPYVGAKGWVGVRLDAQVDWDQLAAILTDGYRLVAPVKLAGKTPGREPGAKSRATRSSATAPVKRRRSSGTSKDAPSYR